MRIGGRSAQGAAHAMFPPTVATLRICGAAICVAASRTAGHASRTNGERINSVMVVRAPIRKPSGEIDTPHMSPIRLIEIKCSMP